jgi:immune inhibitor A
MSDGANIGDGGREGIGDAPTDLGAWEKFQLGWLGCPDCPGGAFYDVAQAGTWSKHVLGPNNRATSKGKQALFTLLPDKERVDQLGAPFEGQFAFFGDAGDDLNTTMTKAVGAGSLTAKVRYDTESGWDYWFLETSSDGTEFTPVLTNLSAPASEDQSGFNSSGAGMTGQSAGYSDGSYVDLTATVPAGTTDIRFRYQTDSAVTRPGVLIDNVALGGGVIGTAETDQEGWTFDGFRRTTGTETSMHFNAYIAEYRNYRGYDQSLATAYNFGFLDSRPNWVEHFPYQDGMLVTYWDESFSDNNVGDHPGGGLVLPVDAHPTFYHSYDGQLQRPRILSFDSTFGLRPTDAITVDKDSQPTRIKSQPAVPVFNDLKDYWFNSDQHAATGDHVGRYQPGWSGVQVP